MDIFVNKLTLCGTEENIDIFIQEQIANGCMSFKSIMPIPEEFDQNVKFNESEFIYSDYDNALIFKRTANGFSYKHVNANIYPYYEESNCHDWMTNNWQASSDIADQELFINRYEGVLEISFSTRYSYPFIWFSELSKRYKNLVCEMETMSYDYRYIKIKMDGEFLNFDRENMPFFHQFDSIGLVEDPELSPLEALGND